MRNLIVEVSNVFPTSKEHENRGLIFGSTSIDISVISVHLVSSPATATVEFKPTPSCDSMRSNDECKSTSDCDWTGNSRSGNCFSTSGCGSDPPPDDSCVKCGAQTFDSCTPNSYSGGKPSKRTCVFA